MVVDARGGWLLPGLVDLHVHVQRSDLEAYVRHGVTTIRNMWGFPELWTLRSEIESGKSLGPTIHTTSPGLDGIPPKWKDLDALRDPDSVMVRGRWID